MQITKRDRVVAALTIMGEALPNHDQDRLAIACVILNRAFNPRWWGKGVADVCLKRRGRWHQFSCWNEGEKHNERWRHLTAAGQEEYAESLVALAPLLAVFDRAVNGERPFPTFEATHYARKDWVNGGRVSWDLDDNIGNAVVIGEHAFYRPQDLDKPEKAIVPYEPTVAPPKARETLAESKTTQGAVVAGASTIGLAGIFADLIGGLGGLDWRVGLAAVLVVAILGGLALVLYERRRKWAEGDR